MQPDESEPRRGWVVVWAAFAALAVIFGISYSFAAFFESFATEFGAARADVSLVFGISGLVYFTLGAFGGMLSDRFGPRLVTGAGMACVVLALLAGSRAGSMAEVIAAYGVVLGIGIALVYTPAIGCVPPWFVRRRGLAAGIASAGIGAGTLLVPLAATAAIATWQWRGGMVALALFAAVVGGTAAALLQRAPAAQRSGGTTAQGATLREALASRRFRWLYAMCLLGAPAMFVPFAHLSASARDAGIAPAQAVGLVGLIGIGSLTGRFVVGALADRFGRPLALVGMEASLGASMLLWLAAPWVSGTEGQAYLLLAAFALWMGLSYGGCVSLMPALCMDFFGARAVSSIIGTLYTGAALGNLAGPWLAGALFDATGSYVTVVVGCAMLSALATAAAWLAVKSVAG
jgi:MFS family permease